MVDEFQIASLLAPCANVIVTIVIGRISLKFARDQAAIAKTQAETAAIQAKTARNKLKFDLLEKRMVIYNAFDKILKLVVTHGNTRIEEEWEFLSAIANARWLFNDQIYDYFINEVHNKVVYLQANNEMAKGMSPGPELTKIIEQQVVLKEHLVAQRKIVDAMMVPFLRVEDC